MAIVTTVDVRTIAPRERHPLIFSTFESLAAGDAMELVNDHEPRPLFHHFAAERPGEFDWTVLEAGPETWRVAIERRAAAPAKTGGDCCGHCSCA